MIPALRRPFIVPLLAAALAAAPLGCRRDKPVPVEELFTVRTLATQLLQRGQLPEAEVQLKKLIELAPEDPLGYANLGLTYLQQGRYPEAESRLLRARKLDPASRDVPLMLAKLYALTGRRAEARSTLETLRRDDPRDAHALYALAQLDASDPDSGAAGGRRQQHLQELLGLLPANLAVRLELVDLHVRRGQADSAVRQLEEVR